MPVAARQPGLQFDRVAATLAALVVVGLAVFLLVRNQPIADPKLFFVLRVVLSFSAATMGATIPGFLDIRWSGSGLVLRAGGALALFVLTFVYTPDVLPDQVQTKRDSSAAREGIAISGNTGPIIFGSQVGGDLTINQGVASVKMV